MGYYKILMGDQVLDITDNPVWITVGRNGIPIRCEAPDARGILSNDGSAIYQIEGAAELECQHESVSVADISEDEYHEIETILGLGGTASEPALRVEWPQEVAEPIPEPDETLNSVKARKIELLRAECQKSMFSNMEHDTTPTTALADIYIALQDQMVAIFVRLSCLIQWVESCASIAEVGAITLESEIPIEFQSNAYRELHT